MSNLKQPSRYRRFASMVYEGILLFGIVFVIGFIFDISTQSRSALMFHSIRQSVLFLAIALYFILSWSRHGQTLAMRTWKMKLVTRRGTKPSMAQMVWRYLWFWPIPLLAAWAINELSNKVGWPSIDMFIILTPFLNFCYSWYDKEGLMIYDRLSGTQLISVEQ